MSEITYPNRITSGLGGFSQAPRWLSTDRPPYPIQGLFGFATDTHVWEGWTGSEWVTLQQGPSTNWADQPSYGDDTEAVAGGVQRGELYRNGNFMMVCLL